MVIFSTISIDGKLASKDYFSNLSCPYDKLRQHILRAEVDAILVGANTVRIDNPKLTIKYAKGENPIRVVISETLNLDPNYRIFDTPPETVIYTSNNTNEKKSEIEYILKKKNIVIRKLNTLNIKNVFEDLEREFNVHKIMIEGGGKLIWSIIKENCFDEIRITISPRIFGNGINFADGEGFSGEESPKLELKDIKLCECKNEVHLIYKNSNKKC